LKLVKIAADELGITAGLNCFTKGDIGACAETALNVASMFVGGLLGKLVTKYAWRWKTAARLIGRLKNIGEELIDSIGGWFKSRKRLARAEDALQRAGGSCPVGKSFPPGTKVLLASGKLKAIEKLALGDKVVATDTGSRLTEARAVVATHIREGRRNLVEVTVDTDGSRGNKTGSIVATDNHEFWVDDQGAWVPAGQLVPGDDVRSPSGQRLTITATRHWTAHQRVHNLTVEGIHTYYVATGQTPVLVHNCPAGAGFPDRPLPRDKNGNMSPDTDVAHTQLGTKSGRRDSYPQAREFDDDGNPVRDIDFTDHGRPSMHGNPHQQTYERNPTGGTMKRGPAEPLEYP